MPCTLLFHCILDTYAAARFPHTEYNAKTHTKRNATHETQHAPQNKKLTVNGGAAEAELAEQEQLQLLKHKPLGITRQVYA
jgi:hypothetical protein